MPTCPPNAMLTMWDPNTIMHDLKVKANKSQKNKVTRWVKQLVTAKIDAKN